MEFDEIVRLKQCLSFNKDEGAFYWAVPRTFKVKVGDRAGSVYKNGYRYICVDRKDYLEHRLVWLWVHGEWPTVAIDHINGIPSDNRPENLRLANQEQNQQNRSSKSKASSGLVGAHFHKLSGLYSSRIGANKKVFYLGYFKTAAEAHGAYLSAKKKLHTFNPVFRDYGIGEQELADSL